MAHQLKATLVAAIESHAKDNPGEPLAVISRAIQQELRRQAESGLLSLGSDKDLTGDSLEIRVFLLFQAMGISIARGRNGLEDFVANPPSGATTSRPLVIEVKSDRKPSVQREDLRQLDDWVFDLPQEEIARKKGLGGRPDALARATHGLVSKTHHHPSPHKGVLVFNAPVGVSFEQRTSPPLSPGELAFAQKRNFCVIPIQELIAIEWAIRQGRKTVLEVWEAINETCGVLSSNTELKGSGCSQ